MHKWGVQCAWPRTEAPRSALREPRGKHPPSELLSVQQRRTVDHQEEEKLVVRQDEAKIVETARHVVQRLMKEDRARVFRLR